MLPEIIHIATDEKFINSGFSQFEFLAPGRNALWVYGSPEYNFTHINISRDRIKLIELNESNFRRIPEKSIVLLHSVPNHLLPFLKFIPDNCIIIGIVFGYEIYSDSRLYPTSKGLDKITRKIYAKRKTLFQKIKNSSKERISFLLRRGRNLLPLKGKLLEIANRETKRERLQRIDYFALPYKEEYEAERKILKLKIPFFKFCYYPLEKILDMDSPLNYDKNSLLIGHSGFSNGNHLDIVHKLKNKLPKGLKVFMPLSYGDENYIGNVITNINKVIPDITYLRHFMPLEEYTQLLSEVKIAIFNNRRQQGMGNIVSLLYLGAKVYLSEKNSLYLFFRNNDIYIFSYEKDLRKKSSLSEGLTLPQIEHNRNRLKLILSQKVLNESLSKSLNEVELKLKNG